MASITIRLKNGQWLALQDIDRPTVAHIAGAVTDQNPPVLTLNLLSAGRDCQLVTADVARLEIDL